jgi:hypothetical protein
VRRLHWGPVQVCWTNAYAACSVNSGFEGSS